MGLLRCVTFRLGPFLNWLSKTPDLWRQGTSKIAAQAAYVTLAHGLMPGNSDGLEVQFFSPARHGEN